MYYTHDERRAMMLANYAKAHASEVAERRALFAPPHSSIKWNANEIESSLRAHAGEMHSRAVARAVNSTKRLMDRNEQPEEVVGDADVEAIAAQVETRTNDMRDRDLRARTIDTLAGFLKR